MYIGLHLSKGKGKGKGKITPKQAYVALSGSGRLRLPDF
jgi:hypothetical protein